MRRTIPAQSATSALDSPTAAPTDSVAKRAALQARHVRRQAPTTPTPAADGRRAAIVVLSAAPVVEHLVTTAPRTANMGTRAEADPAAIHERMLSSEGASYAKSLRDAKAPLVAQLQARGIAVVSQAEHVINAIMIRATDEDLLWLRSQPGVKLAQYLPVRHLHLNTAAALIGAPAAWNQVGGQANAGRGIKIAMLDSGIDITHAMFSGNAFSLPTTPPPSGGTWPLTNAATGGNYTNNKVIVAKNYVCPSSNTSSGCTNSTGDTPSSFDYTATDGLGHGTGTASVAAGNCVPSTPLGPAICGVAPGAYLGNYKIFDSVGNGVSELQAINDAVADGMDVINYSGGGDATGELPSQSLDVTAIHNAAAAGVPVVISAGNCGPNLGDYNDGCSVVGDNTVEDPGIVAEAITAGASTNSHVSSNPVTIISSIVVPANLQTISSYAPQAFPNVGPAVIVDVAALDGTGSACSTLPAGSLAGKIALIMYNYDYPCDPNQPDVTATNNAQAAGAIGVIMIDNIEEEIFISYNYLVGGNIPSTLVTYADGVNLKAFTDANPGGVKATMSSSTGLTPQVADQVGDYSSRGPVNDFTIKPDLLAPGDMYMASQSVNPDPVNAIYDPSGYMYNEGTSYSAPMTSGAAAILKQHWGAKATAYDIKSMLVNTATPITATQDGAVTSVQMTGGGRLNLPAALATTLTANPVSISFGQVLTPAPGTPQSQSVTLKNLGVSSETLTVTVNQSVSNAALTVSAPASVNVSAGGTATLTVTMKLNAAIYGIYEGTVNLKSPSTATAIHIPYWMMLGSANINTGGLLDGAGFGLTVSPGDIVSVFGTGLGTAGMNASIIPLPYDINHTEVTITGNYTNQSGPQEIGAPLFYSSSGQVNFQIPYGLISGNNATLQVYLQGIVGNALTFKASATSPGIFASNGTAVVLHQSGALVTAGNPATAGEIVSIYCAGLGAVNPTIFEGDPSPIPPDATTAAPTVKIGGTPAVVSFSGLTPVFAGLYQINAQVAAGTPTGPQSVTITIGGATSNSPTTYIR